MLSVFSLLNLLFNNIIYLLFKIFYFLIFINIYYENLFKKQIEYQVGYRGDLFVEGFIL